MTKENYYNEVLKNKKNLLKMKDVFYYTVVDWDDEKDEAIYGDMQHGNVKKSIGHIINVNNININKKRLNYNVVGYEIRKRKTDKEIKLFGREFDTRKNTLDSFQHFCKLDQYNNFPILNKTQKLLKLYNFCEEAKKDGWEVKFLYK